MAYRWLQPSIEAAVGNIAKAVFAVAGAPAILDNPIAAGRTGCVVVIADKRNRVVVAVGCTTVIVFQVGHGFVHVIGVESNHQRTVGLQHGLQIGGRVGRNSRPVRNSPRAACIIGRMNGRAGRRGVPIRGIRIHRAVRFRNDAMVLVVVQHRVKSASALGRTKIGSWFPSRVVARKNRERNWCRSAKACTSLRPKLVGP